MQCACIRLTIGAHEDKGNDAPALMTFVRACREARYSKSWTKLRWLIEFVGERAGTKRGRESWNLEGPLDGRVWRKLEHPAVKRAAIGSVDDDTVGAWAWRVEIEESFRSRSSFRQRTPFTVDQTDNGRRQRNV